MTGDRIEEPVTSVREGMWACTNCGAECWGIEIQRQPYCEQCAVKWLDDDGALWRAVGMGEREDDFLAVARLELAKV